MTDFDLARITSLAAEGLAETREQVDDAGHTELRLDNFLIVGIFVYENERGEERESAAVFCESKRRYAQFGILELGHERLSEMLEDDDE